MNIASASRKVEPTKPAAPYVGGKRNLARRIIERIDAIPHNIYVEPFVGMGGIFLRRTAVPKCEVINDWSGDVANFFRILQRHHQPLMDLLQFQLTSRQEFERQKSIDPATLTDLERAARFLYLQMSTFGGKVVDRTFGNFSPRPANFNIVRLKPMLNAIHRRLASVLVECLPYDECISRYDRSGTLFYLDPPYWGKEGYYGKDLFKRSDYCHMARQLAKIQGRFILSLNDTPEVRQVFEGFQIEEAPVLCSVSQNTMKQTHELIISGP